MTIEEATARANSGDVSAMIALGKYYGSENKFVEADEWFEKTYTGRFVDPQGLLLSIYTKKTLLLVDIEITNGMVNNVRKDLLNFLDDGSGAVITDFCGARISDDLALKRRRIQKEILFYVKPFIAYKSNADFINKIIASSDNNRTKKHPKCNRLFSESSRFCGKCGSSLI